MCNRTRNKSNTVSRYSPEAVAVALVPLALEFALVDGACRQRSADVRAVEPSADGDSIETFCNTKPVDMNSLETR